MGSERGRSGLRAGQEITSSPFLFLGGILYDPTILAILQ